MNPVLVDFQKYAADGDRSGAPNFLVLAESMLVIYHLSGKVWPSVISTLMVTGHQYRCIWKYKNFTAIALAVNILTLLRDYW